MSASSIGIIHPNGCLRSWCDRPQVSRSIEEMNGSSLARCGECVRQHLGSSELETHLTEMLDSSGLIAEFSEAYGRQTHENKRISRTHQSIPTLEDINDMLKQNEQILVSLQRVRDIVLSHQDKTLAFTTEKS